MDLFINVKNLIKYIILLKKNCIDINSAGEMNIELYLLYKMRFFPFFLYYYLNRCILNFIKIELNKENGKFLFKFSNNENLPQGFHRLDS